MHAPVVVFDIVAKSHYLDTFAIAERFPHSNVKFVVKDSSTKDILRGINSKSIIFPTDVQLKWNVHFFCHGEVRLEV